MKHLRLFETQKEYQDGILIGSVSDFPMVTYAQNDDALDYFNVPIVKTKVEMIEGPEPPITNHLSIKKLTVDGEIMWEKDTWFKKEYEISQDDFIPDESDNEFIRGQILFKHYDLFNELTMGGKNILIKSDNNATHFLVLVPYDGEYATSHIRGEIYNIEEYIDEFSIKKIDDNTYDVSNFYSDFARISPYQHLIILANENEVIPQTLTYERLGTEAENEVQSMEVTQDNVFTNLVNQGFAATIYGEIDTMDYLGLIMSMNGELLEFGPIPIGEIASMGLGNLESNKFSFDLSALAAEVSGTDVSYCLLDKEVANVSGENLSDILPYVKDATVTWTSFSYSTPLPVGQHEVKIELASYKHLPLMNPNVVTEMDLSSLYGQFVDTVSVCSGAKNLTKIIFPKDLQNIGMHAFDGCTSLTEVVIPDSVTSIDESAFNFCDNLTSITIPNSVTSIGNRAFSYCDSLINVNLGNGVTTIGGGAFANCENLSSITIPNSVTSIGVQAFSGCDSLSSITIPNSVTSIGNYAFSGCDSLTDIVILDSITSIGSDAFRNCSGLSSVNLGNGVTTIGERAFYNCNSLSSIIIPDSVTSINENAFYNTPFYNNLPDGDVYLGKCYYEYKGSMPSNTSIVITDGTISICKSAFYKRKSLISITIPNSVTSIGSSAFEECRGLTEVVIPDSVTSIGSSAFVGCDSLTNVTIGNGVTTIGNLVFHDCDSLTSITIPNSVTSIGSSAFNNCDALSSINIPDSVTSIGDGAFNGCYPLTSIVIPDSVTSIGSNAFANTSFYDNLPDGDVYLGKCYYKYKGEMPSNTSITIKDGTISISKSAFRNCSGLTEVVIPDSITNIGYEAFYGCNNLTSVNLGNGVTTIGERAFLYCGSLSEITCYAITAPTLSYSIFGDISDNGVLRVPNGSDYSNWLNLLPSGWTIEYI